MLDAFVPITSLDALANEKSIYWIDVPDPGQLAAVSEGVALINADEWQTSFNGTGVKVGIIDQGFSGWQARRDAGELPQNTVTNFNPGDEGASPHGTACAEIVYDVAPGAQLYLAKYATEGQFYGAVDWLIDQGVNVISSSVTFPGKGPGDGSWNISEKVDDARAAGILWSQSVGNHAQTHWSGNWTDSVPDGWNEFAVGDETQNITVSTGKTIKVQLNWDDTWGNSYIDFDLYLFDSNLSELEKGDRRQNGPGSIPYEALTFTANYTGVYHIAIKAVNNWDNVKFHLYSAPMDSTLQYQTAASSFDVPADAQGAMAVGAVGYATPTTIKSYSSRGPTKDNRIKPDLVGPTDVSTVSSNPFDGTSASAPHAAGAAALVKQLYSSYDPAYDPAQIQSYLETKAVPLGDPGKDNIFGSGRLYLPYTLPGDANGDGYVNALDLTKVERIIVRLDTPTPEADANLDSRINSIDLTKIERIIVGLDAAAGAPPKGAATADVVIVSVDAPAQIVAGTNFTASVTISQVTSLDAANFNIIFDPAVIQLDNITAGLIGSTTIPVDIYSANSTGNYTVVQNISGLSGVTGSGTLAVLHFYVLGNVGQTSNISLSDGVLSSIAAEEIAATWTGDSVSVIIYTETLRPNGSGSETSIDTQYPSSGSHWDKVDEASPDEDSTYVENKNGAVYSYQRDLYAIQDHLVGSGNINKVTITARQKHNSPSGSGLKISLKTHGAVYDYDYTAYTQSVWHDISHEMTVNPYTGVAWTWAEIDALEAGVSLGGSTYSPDWSRVTQVYVVVNPTSAETLRPNAAGDETNFPLQYPSTGAHWDKVDETSADEESTIIYINGSSGNPYYRDLFNIQNHSAGSGAINSVTVYARVKKLYYTTYAYLAIKTNGTVYESDLKTITTGYPTYPFTTLSYQWTTNPSTGSAWTWAQIDALQAGIRQNAWWYSPDNWDYAKTTQVYAVVDYWPVGGMASRIEIPGSSSKINVTLPPVSDNVTPILPPSGDTTTGKFPPYTDNTTK